MNPRQRVVVTATGMVTPLGDRREAVFEALCAGQSALAPVTRFATEDLPTCPVGEIAFAPRDYLSTGNLRPLDRTGQLATAAAHLALEQADLCRETRAEQRAGLVLGTLYGSVGTIAAFDHRALEAGPKYVKPFDFANSVINAASGQVAIWHGLPGINSTITGGPTAGPQALAYAADAIRAERSDLLLAGGAEELCLESYLACVRGGLLAGSRNGGPPCAIPVEARSNGFALGEGAVLLLLESLESARARGVPRLAEILGAASGYDVSRGADRETAVATVARTVRLALEEASCSAHDVSVVVTGASGHRRNDLHEALGLTKALERDDFPVTAIKGQTGELMGASGALQAAVLIEALRNQRLPGIGGWQEAAPGVPFQALSAQPRHLPAEGSRTGLLTCLGLDGQVSALVVRQG